MQGLREVKPKQSCIIRCQILLTLTSYYNIFERRTYGKKR
ncbi:hypothetical protein GCWU000282_01046 [Catonella morbi ATCC 51271]|uniref:Uncharacterized protein n=1 Tax=Catonella morbi ATCC 51271 TaxID=592026 RepID=V2Y4J8_9FIRM|nr:hypothetical protein GCWU000282_01046 [Catonella morbi ATCC 51271]